MVLPVIMAASAAAKLGGAGVSYYGRKKALDAQEEALAAERARQAALQAKADAILQEVIGQAGWDDTQRGVEREQNTIISGGQRVAGDTGAGAGMAAASLGGAGKAGRVRAAGLGARRVGMQSNQAARIKAELVRRQILDELLGQADVDRQGLASAADRSMRAYQYEKDAAALQGIGERTLGELLGGGGDVIGKVGSIF